MKTAAVCLFVALYTSEACRLPHDEQTQRLPQRRAALTSPATASQHGLIELSLALHNRGAALMDEDGSKPELLNPFLVDVDATFQHAATGTKRRVQAFYDGDGIFKVRFSPDQRGVWTFSTASSCVPALHAHSGRIRVSGSLAGGCPRASAGLTGFVYPNGTVYSPVGTTCYAWLHQNTVGAAGADPDELEESTLRALDASPFNKIRMTAFPKWYPFTHAEPRYYPFEGQYRGPPANSSCHPPNYTDCGRSEWDFTRFNLSFWRHFELRVAQVTAMGVVPEIILFHPFDRINRRCGAEGSTSAAQCLSNPADCLWCDQHYVKYVVARLSSLGVWWSMANEWDLEKSKTVADWDTLFVTLAAADDAHNRERSIHNCVRYYNHSQPWISHISLQGSTVRQLQMAKTTWTHKPITWDEVKYEGNITYGWGALTGYTESRRAWTALLNQVAMAGHSNTNLPAADTANCGTNPGRPSCNAVMWWNKGGRLYGDSPARLSWYRQYLAGELGVQVPPLDQTISTDLAGGQEASVFQLASKSGDYRLLFWRNTTAVVEIDLGSAVYDATHIDWWRMKMMPLSPLQGNIRLNPPAGADSILQLIRQA